MEDSEYREEILRRIDAHYSSTEAPMYLAQLGKNLHHPDGRKLREFIERDLGDDLVIVTDPNVPQRITVARRGRDAELLLKVTSTDAYRSRFPKALQIAFCLKAEEGSEVYYRVSKPMYRVATENPGAAFRAIPGALRLPGKDLGALSAQERRHLDAKIEEWARTNGLQVGALVRRDASDGTNRSDCELVRRLLRAQSPDVLRQLMIPGDIAMMLAEQKK